LPRTVCRYGPPRCVLSKVDRCLRWCLYILAFGDWPFLPSSPWLADRVSALFVSIAESGARFSRWRVDPVDAGRAVPAGVYVGAPGTAHIERNQDSRGRSPATRIGHPDGRSCGRSDLSQARRAIGALRRAGCLSGLAWSSSREGTTCQVAIRAVKVIRVDTAKFESRQESEKGGCNTVRVLLSETRGLLEHRDTPIANSDPVSLVLR
jgi:hypothetical protein